MARLAAPAFDSQHEPIEPPPLYRSEGFAEDLPDWEEPSPPATEPSRRLGAALSAVLLATPLAVAVAAATALGVLA